MYSVLTDGSNFKGSVTVRKKLFEPFLSVTRFSSEEVSAQNQLKASVQRKIRQSIVEEVFLLLIFFTYISVSQILSSWINLVCVLCFLQYPGLEPVLEDLMPKKSPLSVAKWYFSYLKRKKIFHCWPNHN